MRAGNTPVEIRNVTLTSSKDLINISFEVSDKEGDLIEIAGGELSLEDGPFHPLPDRIFQGLPRIPSTPAGIRSNLSFRTSQLKEDENLKELSEPGFAGSIRAIVSGRDYETENPSSAVSDTFKFSDNEPPFAQILPFLPDRALSNGVIPIRYRLFDADGNDADIDVLADWGYGPRTANEFPSMASSGTRHLKTETAITAGGSFHTFLWDALSQIEGQEEVLIQLIPRDREIGVPAIDLFQLSLSPREQILRLCTEYKERIFSGGTSRTLLSGDFNGDEHPDLVTLNYYCNEISYLRGGPGGLQGVVNIPVGEGPWAAYTYRHTGDLNRDGYTDLLVPNSLSKDITYLQGGPGGLSLERNIPLDGGPVNIITGDFDGDGRLEAVVAHYGNPRPPGLTYLKGRSDWDVVDPTEIEMDSRPLGMAAADFDGDGVLDLLVGEEGESVDFLKGIRNQGLGVPLKIPLKSDLIYKVIVSDDFDGDGHPDALVTNTKTASRKHSVTLLRNVSADLGNILKQDIEMAAGQGQFAVTGDFNGDGLPDAAIVHVEQDKITMLGGHSEGLEPLGESISVGNHPYSAAAADMDGDGFFDVLVANIDSNYVAYLRGGPEGLTLSPIRYNVADQPTRVLVDDFNTDGLLDLVAGSSSDFVAYFQDVREGLGKGERVSAGLSPRVLLGDDLDRDGSLDIVAANENSHDLTYLPGDPLMPRNPLQINLGERAMPMALASGDFNGDGRRDLAVADFGVGEESGWIIWLSGGEGGPSWIKKTMIRAGQKPRALASADWNDDGIQDLVAANWKSNDITFLLGSPQGLVAVDTIKVGENPIALEGGDFDGDGFLDLAVANWGDSSVTCLRGGPGGPGNPVAIIVGEHPASPSALERGDFDGDGFLDLVVANAGRDEVVFLRGGPEGLEISGRSPAGGYPLALSSGDYDGDGFLDIVTANYRSGDLSYLRGGTGGLQDQNKLSSGSGPVALASGDGDGDGLTDVVAGNSLSNNLTFFPGRFLIPHENRLVMPPEGGSGSPAVTLLDPRNPPAYRLQLPPGVFDAPTQVCMVPRSLFELPQGEAFRQEPPAFLLAATDPVGILREETVILGPARLTLRLRDQDLPTDPSRLRVITKFPDPAGGETITELDPAFLQIVSFQGGRGAAFTIQRFGTYVVVREMDRERR